jgi:hypothetical protein
MFETEMREANEGRVSIDAHPGVLRKMLEFMYTGQEPNLHDALEGIRLLEASALYQIDALKVMRYIRKNCLKMKFKTLLVKIYLNKI